MPAVWLAITYEIVWPDNIYNIHILIMCFIAVCNLVMTLRPRQNVRHFADDILKCFFLNENLSILIKIELKFVPKCPFDNIPRLVRVIAQRRGDKLLSKPIMFSVPTHICVTRPQWVKPVDKESMFQNIYVYNFQRCYGLKLCQMLFWLAQESYKRAISLINRASPSVKKLASVPYTISNSCP